MPGLGEARRKAPAAALRLAEAAAGRQRRGDRRGARASGPRPPQAVVGALRGHGAARRRRSTRPPARSSTGRRRSRTAARRGSRRRTAASVRRPAEVRGRHRHVRRRPQHRRQGAGGPRLVRRRQPAARAAARRWPSSPAAAAGPCRAIAVVVDVRGRAFFADLHRAPSATLRRARRRRRACSSSRPPTTCWSAASRASAGRTRCRASGRHRSTASPRERDAARASCAATPTWSSTPPTSTCTSCARRSSEAFAVRRRRQLRVTRACRFGFKYGLPVDADFVVDVRFLPNPHWVPELRAAHRPRPGRVATTCWASRARRSSCDRYAELLRAGRPPATCARASGIVDRRHRLHRRQAPQRRDGRGARPAARGRRRRRPGQPPRPGARVSVRPVNAVDGRPRRGRRPRRRPRPVRVAARPAPGDVDGSPPSSRSPTTAAPAAGCATSSACCPPGDLRMALAALCGDDDWGRTWARVLQHRFARRRARLPGHAVGNLLSWRSGSCSATRSRASTGSAGCSAPRAGCCRWRSSRSTSRPTCVGLDPAEPDARARRSAARSRWRPRRGQVRGVRLEPARPAGLPGGRCAAVRAADWVVLGPGSLVHQRASRTCWCPSSRAALVETPGPARRRAQPRSRSRARPRASRRETHLEVLAAHAPDLRRRRRARRPGARVRTSAGAAAARLGARWVADARWSSDGRPTRLRRLGRVTIRSRLAAAVRDRSSGDRGRIGPWR